VGFPENNLNGGQHSHWKLLLGLPNKGASRRNCIFREILPVFREKEFIPRRDTISTLRRVVHVAGCPMADVSAYDSPVPCFEPHQVNGIKK